MIKGGMVGVWLYYNWEGDFLYSDIKLNIF